MLFVSYFFCVCLSVYCICLGGIFVKFMFFVSFMFVAFVTYVVC